MVENYAFLLGCRAWVCLCWLKLCTLDTKYTLQAFQCLICVSIFSDCWKSVNPNSLAGIFSGCLSYNWAANTWWLLSLAS